LSEDTSTGAKRELLVAAGGFLLFALVSFGLLMVLNPASPVWSRRTQASAADGPIKITLLHTNDTWGYLRGYG